MYLKSKKTSLLILAVTSLVCSRVMFIFFNDPEGPNLLVVIGAAAIIYFLSLAADSFFLSRRASLTHVWRIVITILIQILIAVVLYLCMK